MNLLSIKKWTDLKRHYPNLSGISKKTEIQIIEAFSIFNYSLLMI